MTTPLLGTSLSMKAMNRLISNHDKKYIFEFIYESIKKNNEDFFIFTTEDDVEEILNDYIFC